MKKRLLLLYFFTTPCWAHASFQIIPLQLPAVLKAAQQVSPFGTVRIYKRNLSGHEGYKNSLYLYLHVSENYLKHVYPLLDAALQRQYPAIKPSHNMLGLHISLLSNAPKSARSYVGKCFHYRVTHIKLVQETKNAHTPQQYHRYFVGLYVQAPKLVNMLNQIKPNNQFQHLHISIAEWNSK